MARSSNAKRKRRTETFVSEAELHSLLLRAIKRDDLEAIIDDSAEVRRLSRRESSAQFPQFSIDHLARLKAIRAAGEVLEALSQLSLLTSDRNVSLTSGEVLRPDLVCINPERQSVVLIELKKAGQTGRQSLTELLAYEHEIKNHLPMISDYDFSFVLISPEWTPLMDHAVSSAIAWSNRKILCLIPRRAKRKLRLETYLPTAWKVTGSVFFPPDAMPSVTLCLYDRPSPSARKTPYRTGSKDHREGDKEPVSDEGIDPRIWTAMDVIAREGDRTGSHGFAVLWKDFSGLSQTTYNITLCSIAPFAFYRESRRNGSIAAADGRLAEQLDLHMRRHDPSGHSGALMAVGDAARPLLDELASVSLEGFHSWDTDRRILRRRAQPLLTEFWGALGDYAREYVLNPAIRTYRRNLLQNGLGDWRDPRVGIPLIETFTRPELFFEGEIRCSDAFRFGVLWGLDRVYRMNLRRSDHPQLRLRFLWNRGELMAAVDELRLLADAAVNVSPPDEPLQFFEDPLVDDDSHAARAHRWIVEEVFQGAPVHKLFMDVGIIGSLLFDERRQGLMGAGVPDAWRDNVEHPLRLATGIILSLYRKLEAEGGLTPEMTARYARLRKSLGLRIDFAAARLEALPAIALVDSWDACLRASDLVVDQVYHRHAPVAPATLDWEWLKQGVSEMRRRGEEDAGIILLPNGQIVSGRVLPTELAGFRSGLTICEDDEVPFLDRSHGIGHLRKVRWAELEDGSAFEQPRRP